MWQCLNCKEDVEDSLAICWNCEADQEGVLPEKAVPVGDHTDDDYRQFLNRKTAAKNCVQCHAVLTFVGTRKFHEGSNWGIFGDFGELFVGHTSLEMYTCPTCLRVEFFVSDPLP
ncbi:MAG TPA: hypothetical protein VLL54_10820 [Pyrinomonadaceae bacterium]|nr:hypothetical protein [Pyrinomonadaceae bacterium]